MESKKDTEPTVTVEAKTYLFILKLFLLFGLLSLGIFLIWQYFSLSFQLDAVTKEYSTYKTAMESLRKEDFQRAVLEDEKARSREIQLTFELNAARNVRDAKIHELKIVTDRSGDELKRLQSFLQGTSNALNSYGQTSTDPSTRRLIEAGATASKLFAQCAARYRDVAQRADEAIIAGQSCEASYDAAVRAQLDQ